MITILIPAYNEEGVIEKCILQIVKDVDIKEGYELLVVNDGSKDKTLDILTNLSKKYKQLKIINHPVNKGLGGALRTGFKNAKGRIIITMDSDLTHPPVLINKLVEEMTPDVDVVLASRYVKGGGMKNVPWYRVMISVAANKFFGIILGTSVKDITAGFKAYRADVIKSIKTKERNFEVQLEIMVRLIKKKTRFKEIPLMLVNREIGESKFNLFKAVPKYALNIIKLFFVRWF